MVQQFQQSQQPEPSFDETAMTQPLDSKNISSANIPNANSSSDIGNTGMQCWDSSVDWTAGSSLLPIVEHINLPPSAPHDATNNQFDMKISNHTWTDAGAGSQQPFSTGDWEAVWIDPDSSAGRSSIRPNETPYTPMQPSTNDIAAYGQNQTQQPWLDTADTLPGSIYDVSLW
ncbi:uncharacterized protein BKCO1_5000066 [Diplodia corticola]|uniref:Uncharacterized protein n=1 Tax=Diplodia corticola TaxID=236234 RepID=A0A1J9QQP9_9PEZI|nr:uncharacterized protein BKCO1_5000066 [Diplodia corticola]OJD31262.1 hypothetical protein BKCO1_5000066 [Diplodia corticola]